MTTSVHLFCLLSTSSSHFQIASLFLSTVDMKRLEVLVVFIATFAAFTGKIEFERISNFYLKLSQQELQ
jgi:hypothetical protein